MANGEETMHDASGEGDAQLRNNIAIANIKDETDKNCRVTITFNANQARVAIPDTCHFNITLDGVYKKTVQKLPKNRQIKK